MSSILEPKRKRAKKPKVKTGCRTCKIRRVKCDEIRPECLRCQRYGKGYCDGYEKTEEEKKETSLLRPKSAALAVAKPALRGDLVNQVFGSQDEFQCFRAYCEDVAPRLSGSNRSMWHQLLLQSGQDQPFIRHAIIAIGALNRSVQDVGMGIVQIRSSSADASGSEDGSTHEELTEKLSTFALDHYGKFLRGAKGQISITGKGAQRRNALLACLLVVCIENLQYHYGNALAHAQYGFRMIKELVATSPGSKEQNGLSSPLPGVVEDELIQQFHRMEIQTMITYDWRTPEEHLALKHDGTTSIKDMPQTFTSIDEARLCLDVIMRRTFHFIVSSVLHGKLSEEQSDVVDRDPNQIFTVPSVEYPAWIQGMPDTLQVEQEMYASENRAWAQAFEPLLQATLRSVERPEAIPVLLMKIHSWTMTIRLAGSLSATELIFEHFIPEFEGIIKYARILLNHPNNDRHFRGGAFSFDMGLIYPLATTGLSCRDRKLRRECIELLSSHCWREGQWGSESSATVVTWLMEVEEEGVNTDYIPEWARARLSGLVADLENKTLHLHCVRGFGDNVIKREAVRHVSGTV